MSNRLDYLTVAPKLTQAFYQFTLAAHGASIEAELRHLVDIRASQLNGCAFWVDMHIKEAKISGERELRLHHIAVWRESPLFSARERAALEWTEAVTQLPPGGIPDDLYARAREAFSEAEIVDLTFSIIAINGWNRGAVAFRMVPGSKDETFGLKKAGLS
ncbi:carboxymuconolactone decarboxylase family protein [Rhabdaerophilum calidifontis]|uniref:carboxymuconolactone decarboxylase family protein n=1 Tax=Rhabdaerophilum calidifontis TaxID=2604328 RepID=UPI001239F767|nr:carboxymuconolactone decarboxylase family protein [Rhabdaerophilum calidifontis]